MPGYPVNGSIGEYQIIGIHVNPEPVTKLTNSKSHRPDIFGFNKPKFNISTFVTVGRR